ncbi:MAG: hypothetical protein J6X82_06985 [Bacteroidales bacterium]|nr:hypothetical protein [Bacteroidales bacterium]
MISIPVFAQSKDYRAPGYKGSVSLTDQIGVFVGLETSHGIMFSHYHYLGVGAGAFVFPNGSDYPWFSEAFLDYQYYILSKRSTPFAGLQVGYIQAMGHGNKVNGFDHAYSFAQGVNFKPSIGWSWAFNSGIGFTLSAGANIILPFGSDKGTSPVVTIPKIAFALSF